MRIKHKISQHRRDFSAIYECEHCSHEQEGTGYDDAYFHNSVIPQMSCKQCGKRSPTLEPTSAPDVPAGVVL